MAPQNDAQATAPEMVATDAELAAALPMGATTSNTQVKFGRHIRTGGHGSAWYAVINGFECVVKTVSGHCQVKPTHPINADKHQFKSDAVFFQELKAYNLIQKIPMLKNRVPSLLGVLTGTAAAIANTGHEGPVKDRAIVIEYCHGATLEAMEGHIEDAELDRMKLHMIETLQILHYHGIAHGDPFANNIIIAEDGNARLIDFSHPKFREMAASDTQWKFVTDLDYNVVCHVFQSGNASVSHGCRLGVM